MNLDLIDKELRKLTLIQEGLFFKLVTLEELRNINGKEIRSPRYEIRRGSSFFIKIDTVEEGESIVAKLNSCTEEFINTMREEFKRVILKELS